MKHIKIYKPLDGPAQAAEFIEGLEPRLRDKVVRQILYLSRTPSRSSRSPTTSTSPSRSIKVSMSSGRGGGRRCGSSSPPAPTGITYCFMPL